MGVLTTVLFLFFGLQILVFKLPNNSTTNKIKNTVNYINTLPISLFNLIKLNIFHYKKVDLTNFEIESTLEKAAINDSVTRGMLFKNISTSISATDDPNNSNIKYIKLQSEQKLEFNKKLLLIKTVIKRQ